jgi:hypothetical protein
MTYGLQTSRLSSPHIQGPKHRLQKLHFLYCYWESGRRCVLAAGFTHFIPLWLSGPTPCLSPVHHEWKSWEFRGKETPVEIMDLDLHIQKRKWTENKRIIRRHRGWQQREVATVIRETGNCTVTISAPTNVCSSGFKEDGSQLTCHSRNPCAPARIQHETSALIQQSRGRGAYPPSRGSELLLDLQPEPAVSWATTCWQSHYTQWISIAIRVSCSTARV